MNRQADIYHSEDVDICQEMLQSKLSLVLIIWFSLFSLKCLHYG